MKLSRLSEAQRRHLRKNPALAAFVKAYEVASEGKVRSAQDEDEEARRMVRSVRVCSACEVEDDDEAAKFCKHCGGPMADVEGYTDEDEVTYSMGLPEKSPHSASDSEGYGMRSGYSADSRRGTRADEAIKTFGRTYKRRRG